MVCMQPAVSVGRPRYGGMDGVQAAGRAAESLKITFNSDS